MQKNNSVRRMVAVTESQVTTKKQLQRLPTIAELLQLLEVMDRVADDAEKVTKR